MTQHVFPTGGDIYIPLLPIYDVADFHVPYGRYGPAGHVHVRMLHALYDSLFARN
jgi:hypothetical protein